MFWIERITPRTESKTAAEFAAHGIRAEVPCTLTIKWEAGNGIERRIARTVDTPILPGLMFCEGTGEAWQASRYVPGIRGGPAWLPSEAVWLAHVRPWLDRCAATLAEQRAQHAAGQAVQLFTPGQMVEILDGEFRGRLARFAGVAERAGEILARIEIGEFCGQPIPLTVAASSIEVAE